MQREAGPVTPRVGDFAHVVLDQHLYHLLGCKYFKPMAKRSSPTLTTKTAPSGTRSPELLTGLKPAFRTDLGSLFVGDCLPILRSLPDSSLDLVITSPPSDQQPKYKNGERYDRNWYRSFFLDVTAEILKKLKPHGNFVLNYRSKRHGDERGIIQYSSFFGFANKAFSFARISFGESRHHHQVASIDS